MKPVQHVTVLNTVGYCNTVVTIVILWDHRRICCQSLTETTGISSEKRVVRRFRRCASVIECTYTNLDSIAYYTPRLHGIAYCF